MGYNFEIGPLRSYKEDGVKRYHTRVVHLENAPADGSPTDKTNQRWPSYSGWSQFIDDAGLDDLFKELMPEHPGYAILTKEHQETIDEAYKRKDTFQPENIGRIEWLKFWVDWALANCKKPSFINS